MQLSCSVSGLAACKTELTRLQLPGSGGGLELVVVLQCCVLLQCCSLLTGTKLLQLHARRRG